MLVILFVYQANLIFYKFQYLLFWVKNLIHLFLKKINRAPYFGEDYPLWLTFTWFLPGEVMHSSLTSSQSLWCSSSLSEKSIPEFTSATVFSTFLAPYVLCKSHLLDSRQSTVQNTWLLTESSYFCRYNQYLFYAWNIF